MRSATVTNTDTIVVGAAQSKNDERVHITHDFTPGFADEPGGFDEIELAVDLRSGTGDGVGIAIAGDTAPRAYVVGGSQINLNAAEVEGVDADVTLDGVEEIVLSGALGDDLLSGAGGREHPTSRPGSTCASTVWGGTTCSRAEMGSTTWSAPTGTTSW